MQPIPTEFTEGHFQYRQIERYGDLAIYSQTHTHGSVTRYEVVRIRMRPAHTWPTGLVTPEHEGYPGASSWGRDGFTCFALEEASAVLAAWASRITEDLDDEPSEAAVSTGLESAEQGHSL
jgi:hypothetical protein